MEKFVRFFAIASLLSSAAAQAIECPQNPNANQQPPFTAACCNTGVGTGGNLIAFNTGNGVDIRNMSANNLVTDNCILNNRLNGVEVEIRSANNVIQDNTISGNGDNGVLVTSKQ